MQIILNRSIWPIHGTVKSTITPRVDLGVMAMKRLSILLRFAELDPHYQIQSIAIFRALFFSVFWAPSIGFVPKWVLILNFFRFLLSIYCVQLTRFNMLSLRKFYSLFLPYWDDRWECQQLILFCTFYSLELPFLNTVYLDDLVAYAIFFITVSTPWGVVLHLFW